MPIREFKCTECGSVNEEILSMNDETKIMNCSLCGSPAKKVEVPKGTSFQLKGKGWFKDGY